MPDLAENSTQSEVWGPWQEARAHFDAGAYSKALQSLQAAPMQTANFHYNLGTVYYQLGNHGQAVAHLEKANRLKPHDSAIQHNLKLARTQLERRIGETRLDSASSWAESVADQLPFDEVRGVMGAVVIVLIVFWGRAYWKTRSIRKTLLQPAAVLTFLALLLTTGLYWVEKSGETHPAAIALEPQIIRSGPGEQFIELSRVESGSKLRVLGGNSAWSQIRFGADDIGWVPASSLLLL
jgi:tetratricopeptide (TPR) repeat protein